MGFCLHVCMSTTCVPGACGGQGRGALDLSEMELLIAVSCHVGGINLGPLETEQVLLTTEPSFLGPLMSF